MGGWLWAFGIPLFMLGPFLAVPRPERPGSGGCGAGC